MADRVSLHVGFNRCSHPVELHRDRTTPHPEAVRGDFSKDDLTGARHRLKHANDTTRQVLLRMERVRSDEPGDGQQRDPVASTS